MAEQVHLVTHPLAQSALTAMRDAQTSSAEFRRQLHQVATLLAVEATRDLPTASVEVQTPLAKAAFPTLSATPITIVPILRAGLGMLDAFLTLLPTASVGHLGLERDEQTKKASRYYLKLPKDFTESEVFVIDPMLATGGSSVDAIDVLLAEGARSIRLINIIAAPSGIEAVRNAHPEVPIYVAAIDEGLNDDAYILPGLGDAGDRYFNTL